MIAVPLSAKNRVVGLIEAFSTETSSFNDTDVRSLNLLGELILAAIRPEEEDRLAELARKGCRAAARATQESTEIEDREPRPTPQPKSSLTKNSSRSRRRPPRRKPQSKPRPLRSSRSR